MPEEAGKEEPLQEFGSSLGEIAGRIEDQVHLKTGKKAIGTRTTITIDHRLPDERDGSAGWRISTRKAHLPETQFGSHDRHCIKTASGDRGRAIFCEETQSGEVVAAASYHLDDRKELPVLVTCLAFRTDAGDNAALNARSLDGALVLKHHIHAIARKAGRGGHLDIDLADRREEELFRRLGFRKAPKVPGFRPASLHLRQDDPAQSSGGT